MPKQSALKLIFYGLSLLTLAACQWEFNSSEEEDDGIIHIGVAWPRSWGLFVEGTELAAKEANQIGGILGQKVELIIDEREEKSLELLENANQITAGDRLKQETRIIARDFSNDPRKITAVTGHGYSSMTFAAANIYEQKRMVLVSPYSSGLLLGSMNLNYLFRIFPNNRNLGKQQAEYAVHSKIRRIAIINDRGLFSQEIGTFLAQNAASQSNIHTVLQRSLTFSVERRELTTLILDIDHIHKKEPLDAIYVLTSGRLATLRVIKEIRRLGLKDIPLIGADEFKASFWEDLAKWQKESPYVANFGAPVLFLSQHPENQAFVKRFQQEYDKKPTRLAALGYDAINIILRAIQQTGSAGPRAVSDSLRYMKPCQGRTGIISFVDGGDVKYRPTVFKWLTKEGFIYKTQDDKLLKQLPGYHLPRCAENDNDHDGVLNQVDRCPKTKKDALKLGVYLTGEKRGCAKDRDHDGVPDYQDQCPDDSIKAQKKGIESNGCPIDSDQDNIPDFQDACPFDTPEMSRYGVTHEGCAIDHDQDGIPDYKDRCPKNHPKEITKGIDLVGCPLDSDQDGVPDYWDKCPSDTKKTLRFGVNQQGCPITESDLNSSKR
ncbi:ABC transporter substrate-binding protein [Magnetococcales bacterium HHB-1]